MHLIERFKSIASTFKVNFRWSDWVNYIDGWIPKLSLSVPVVGYLILFNDQISEMLQFKHLVGPDPIFEGLDGITRLRLLYFGFIFLGISNFIFRLCKPYAFKFGRDVVDYSRTCLEVFTRNDFSQFHYRIRGAEGHYTQHGKYFDSEWDGFFEMSKNSGEGTDEVTRDGDWEGAKRKYGSLLRGMLADEFFRQDSGGRIALSSCVILSTLGYIFIATPSIDLFAKVVLTFLT